jgi:hypothetical protein
VTLTNDIRLTEKLVARMRKRHRLTELELPRKLGMARALKTQAGLRAARDSRRVLRSTASMGLSARPKFSLRISLPARITAARSSAWER